MMTSCPLDDDDLNCPNAKTNAANETNKEPTDGSGTTVSTHAPGSDVTDPSPTIPDSSSRLPKSTTLPESFSVWMNLISAGVEGRKNQKLEVPGDDGSRRISAEDDAIVREAPRSPSDVLAGQLHQ